MSRYEAQIQNKKHPTFRDKNQKSACWNFMNWTELVAKNQMEVTENVDENPSKNLRIKVTSRCFNGRNLIQRGYQKHQIRTAASSEFFCSEKKSALQKLNLNLFLSSRCLGSSRWIMSRTRDEALIPNVIPPEGGWMVDLDRCDTFMRN